jgi:TolB-like protein/Tfp pilus assembly protein PilF
MAEFFAELKRRQIYRVAAAYAVVAWLLLQLFNNVAPIYELPPWVGRAFVFLLALGFPVALLYSLIQRLRTGETAPRERTNRLDWILVGCVATVVLLIGYQQITPSSDATTRQAAVDVARDASASPATAISLAVLPFTNLSDDASQEFFSDGITEEIIAALARIPDLRVVARGSASQFKGERRDLRAVGQALGATHLIEGSVRKAGTRVRITAQLVKADDGVNAWVNTYDRELTDVFAIQEEIATAIAGALRMPLGLRPGERLVSNRDIDPESYQQYLGARAVIRTVVNQPGAAERRIAAIEALEQVVARYPGYAPAWAQLALGYYRRFNIGTGIGVERRRAKDEFLPKAEAAARRAIELDADLADGYPILGVIILTSRWDLAQADEQYSKALALDPFHPETLHFYANLLGAVGRVKEALAMREQLIVMEPFGSISDDYIEELRWIGGQTDTVALMERLSAVRGRINPARAMLARIYAEQGRYTEAVDALMAIRFPGRYPEEAVDAAVRLLRTAPAAAASAQSLPRLYANLEFVYLHVGAPERVLQPFEDIIAGGEFPGGDMVWLWHPSYAPARKTERFKAFARNAGLVDYWRAKGWPEFCRPVGADDFACQ